MTPLEVAQGMANFLKERLAEYEERGGKEFHVYAGFLPRARRVEELEKLCPAIVIRPEVTTDEAKQSTGSLVLYATVYDPDFKEGCQSLFHLLEFIRAHLLMGNPVAGKFWIQPGMKSIVPDEQPYPQWLGVVECEVVIPQVRQNNPPIGWWTL